MHDENAEGILRGRIEAILFVTGEPVRLDELAKALDISRARLDQELNCLRDEYDFGQRGFCVKRFGEHVQLATRALYSADVVRLLQPVQRRLCPLL